MSATATTPAATTANARAAGASNVPPVFDYRAASAAGDVITGYIEGENRTAAERNLKESGLRALKLGRGAVGKKRMNRKWGPAEQAKFAGQLAAHRRAGRTYDSAMMSIARTTSHLKLRNVAEAVALDIQNGLTAEMAFKKHPEVFTADFIASVALGEGVGKDVETLEYFKRIQEQQDKTWRAVKTSLRYPSAVALIAVVAVVAIMIWFVPALKGIYESLLGPGRGELPMPTRVVIAISNTIASVYGVGILIALGAGYAWLKAQLRTEAGQKSWQRLQLKVPKLGPIYRHIHASRSCYAISMMANAGVDLTNIFLKTAEGSTNIAYREIFMHIHRVMQEGASLGDAFRPFMWHLGYDILSVCDSAETNGELDVYFGEHAKDLDTHVNEELEAFTAWIEPAAMVTLGVTIGGILIALWTPLFTLIGTMANAGGK